MQNESSFKTLFSKNKSQIWFAILMITPLLFSILLVLKVPLLASSIFANLGWSNYLKRVTCRNMDCNIKDAIYYFEHALQLQPTSRRSQIGLGIGYLVKGDDIQAIDTWKNIKATSDEILGFGNGFKIVGDPNEALTIYKIVDNVIFQDEVARDRIGELCQQTFAKSGVLQTTNFELCTHYFKTNGDNFIVNGDFAQGNYRSWLRHYTKGSVYTIDLQKGHPSPAIMLSGQIDQYHAGIFQKIVLPPGKHVTFSAWIKVEPVSDMRIFPLYMKAVKAGQELVGASKPISTTNEWTYFERKFVTIEADEGTFSFYPVFFKGIGTIWIDKVEVKVEW